MYGPKGTSGSAAGWFGREHQASDPGAPLQNSMSFPVGRFKSLFFAFLLLCSACARQAPFDVAGTDSSDVKLVPTGNAEFSVLTGDSSDVNIVTSDPANSDATCTISEKPVLTIGADDEDVNQMFTTIRGMGRLSDGSVVVVDRRSAEVRIFGETGQHLRTMGGEHGEAPGEFLNPFLLWITSGDTLWVGDYRPWRYNVFTARGEFVRRVSLDPPYLNPSRAGGVLDNGYSVNARESRAYREDFSALDTMEVEIHDPGGRLVGTIARIPHGSLGQVSEAEDNFWLHPLYQASAEVDALGSTVVLGHGSKPEVRVLDEEFNLRMIIRWSEPERKVLRADVRAYRRDYRERYYRPLFLGWDRNDEAMISPERPVAAVFPVMSSVRIGRDGRIWIRLYDRPREDRGWLAFDADGRFTCHMANLPGGVREFGADYVLLLHEDERGLETLQMYELEIPVTRPDLAATP